MRARAKEGIAAQTVFSAAAEDAVVVKGKFINTHVYTLKYCRIKLTVKCQGKVIGTKTINSGTLRPNQVKTVTVKLDKSKTGYDLRAGGTDWYYTVISWY